MDQTDESWGHQGQGQTLKQPYYSYFDILEISHSVAGPNVEKSNAAFTPVQQVARNLMLVARNKLRVARSLLRATSCAGVNAA